MKIGFNEGCNRFCENHSVLEDLDLCEKYGVDYIIRRTIICYNKFYFRICLFFYTF